MYIHTHIAPHILVAVSGRAADVNAVNTLRPSLALFPVTLAMDWSAMNLSIRASLLFITGCFFAVVINLLQVQNNITLFPADTSWTYKLLYSVWWVPPSVGAGAAIIGIAYPCFDEIHVFDLTKKEPIGWSSVIRCVAVFVGINHASAVSSSLVHKIS